MKEKIRFKDLGMALRVVVVASWMQLIFYSLLFSVLALGFISGAGS